MVEDWELDRGVKEGVPETKGDAEAYTVLGRASAAQMPVQMCETVFLGGCSV